MLISFSNYYPVFNLVINILLFFVGVLGLIFNRRNILILIMSIELMLLSVNLNFITFSKYLDDVSGQLFVLFILTVAASESAIGLSILSLYNKLLSSINIYFNNNKKG